MDRIFEYAFGKQRNLTLDTEHKCSCIYSLADSLMCVSQRLVIFQRSTVYVIPALSCSTVSAEELVLLHDVGVNESKDRQLKQVDRPAQKQMVGLTLQELGSYICIQQQIISQFTVTQSRQKSSTRTVKKYIHLYCSAKTRSSVQKKSGVSDTNSDTKLYI